MRTFSIRLALLAALAVAICAGCAAATGAAGGEGDGGGGCDAVTCDDACQAEGFAGGVCQEDGSCDCVGGDADADADTDADSDADADSGPDTDADTDADTDPPESPLTLYFRELSAYLTLYEGHQLLVGPAASTDPGDGDWTVLAEGEEMKPADSGEWVLGLPVSLAGHAGTDVRVALRFTGDIADDWYVDDLCVATVDGPDYPDSCDVFAEGFDGASAPELPAGWTTVAGPEAASETLWSVATDEASSAPSSAFIPGDSGIDAFLVSPVITLPAP